jgi:hypothetical protein
MNLSAKKKDKISEQILALLYSANPRPMFTSHIAEELARDDALVKALLIDLKKKNLVLDIRKNPQGRDYARRARWKMSDQAYSIYKNKQQ